MNEYDATENAYKNGYDAGYRAAKKDMHNAEYVITCPCKPGDVIYIIEGNVLTTNKCTGFWVTTNWIQIQLLDGRTFTCWDGVTEYFNKTIFTDMKLALAELEKIK